MSNTGIIRMTTPTIIFDVDVDLTTAPKISVAFRQLGRNVLLLNKDELTVTTTTISHTFTQEESQQFRVSDMQIQIKALTADGRVISHDPVETSASIIFDERVFSNGEV